MKEETHSWWWAMALLSMLAATGCTAESVASKPTETTPKKEEVVTKDPLETIYFETGRSTLSPEMVEKLKKNVEWLQQNPPYLIEITGYSDKRGSSKRNQTLAERRAFNVRDMYLTLGIPKSRMLVKGKQEEPECAALTEECFQQSRRVETKVEDKSLAEK